MTALELLINEGDIIISDCPITKYGRIARVILKWDPMTKEVTLDCWICYTENGERINSQRFQPYTVQLKATSDTFVDPSNGEFVSPETPGSITGYDYFVSMANNNINIFQVILHTVQKRDMQGKFDL